MNASKKVLWLEEHLPEVDEIIILINKSGHGYGKERVAMMEEDAIFIDDHPKNLKSTNASKSTYLSLKRLTLMWIGMERLYLVGRKLNLFCYNKKRGVYETPLFL